MTPYTSGLLVEVPREFYDKWLVSLNWPVESCMSAPGWVCRTINVPRSFTRYPVFLLLLARSLEDG